MFGMDSTILAIVALSGLSAGALAYAFLFRTIANERKADKRLPHGFLLEGLVSQRGLDAAPDDGKHQGRQRHP